MTHVVYPEYDYEDHELCDGTNKTTKCKFYQKFCSTKEAVDCDLNPLCFEKGCDWDEQCKSVGTYEIINPKTKSKLKITCCQGDLCNSPKQSSQNHSSYQSCSFYALF